MVKRTRSNLDDDYSDIFPLFFMCIGMLLIIGSCVYRSNKNQEEVNNHKNNIDAVILDKGCIGYSNAQLLKVLKSDGDDVLIMDLDGNKRLFHRSELHRGKEINCNLLEDKK